MQEKKIASVPGEKKRSNGWKERQREGKMERMGREGRDVMRHCMVVKREMGKVKAMLCVIEWIQTELKDETSWCCGSGEEYDLLTDLHVIAIMHKKL